MLPGRNPLSEFPARVSDSLSVNEAALEGLSAVGSLLSRHFRTEHLKGSSQFISGLIIAS